MLDKDLQKKQPPADHVSTWYSKISKLKCVRKSAWVTGIFIATFIFGGIAILYKPSFAGLSIFGVSAETTKPLTLHGRAVSGAIAIIIYWMVLLIFVHRDLMARRYICDSTYYLGFIFTLLSLMCSFTDFGAELSPNTTGFKKMVSFAGAALLTTMVAIILRVIHRHIYNNDDAMPDESIEQRLEQLVKAFEDASKTVCEQTSNIDSEMGNLSVAIGNVTTGVTNAATEMNNAAAVNMASQRDIWGKYTGMLAQETQSFIDELREANRVSVTFRGRTIERLVPSMNAASDSLRKFSRNLEGVSLVNNLNAEVTLLGESLCGLISILEAEKAHRQRNIFSRIYYYIFGA